MKNIILLSLILIIGCSMQSNQSESLEIAEISLPSMQCHMCVATIGNSLSKIDGIIKYKVKIEELNVTIKYDIGKISLQQIEQIISQSGYQANDKEADLEAYEKLPICCKLPVDR